MKRFFTPLPFMVGAVLLISLPPLGAAPLTSQGNGTTIRVSVASDGTQGNNVSGYHSAISADGRYVAFRSDAFNLVPGDTNGTTDVFVHDMQTGQTTRVSVTSDGPQGRDDWYESSLPTFPGLHGCASDFCAGVGLPNKFGVILAGLAPPNAEFIRQTPYPQATSTKS
ncbi:MAG: hypothetical protein Q8O86_13075 [Dehalococcoidia bacterium]|nr:hypothetical protein [Dehalococcoidia bacterium]